MLGSGSLDCSDPLSTCSAAISSSWQLQLQGQALALPVLQLLQLLGQALLCSSCPCACAAACRA
jgi:hypothetical protein